MKKKKKILTVLGARPQFIKSGPLSRMMMSGGLLKEVVVHTGQHYDFRMYKAFLKELSLGRPHYFLNVNRYGNVDQVRRMVKKLKVIIKDEKPDMVLVYGDTNSTLAGALASGEMGIPLAHVEAGMRVFRMEMAEEFNRVATDRISDLLFAPVSEAVKNLKKEGLTRGVYLVGDVLFDVLNQHRRFIDNKFLDIAKDLKVAKGGYCFFTLHRAETVDSAGNLRMILKNIGRVGIDIIFPVHPRTGKRIREFKLGGLSGRINFIKPRSYIETLALVKNAFVTITDSGGVQREAYMLKTPCITLRDRTEWNETLKSGWNRLLPVNKRAMFRLPALIEETVVPGSYSYIFGDGQAAKKIFKIIKDYIT